MIKYDKLWITLKEKGLTKYKLNAHYKISKSQLHRLQHNQSVSTNTIDRICNILECDVSDVMETHPGRQQILKGMDAKLWHPFLLKLLS